MFGSIKIQMYLDILEQNEITKLIALNFCTFCLSEIEEKNS